MEIRLYKMALVMTTVIIVCAISVNSTLAVNPDPLQSIKDQVHTALAAVPDPSSSNSVKACIKKPNKMQIDTYNIHGIA